MAKRFFDVLAALCALVVCSPLLIAIALLIKFDSRGPVFFSQIRLGKGLRPFKIIKFRTMGVGAETRGLHITVARDARVTRVGRILRRFDLDELPTFLNVLRGDMSIVGPRPEVPEFLAFYSDEDKQVFSVPPGMTDLGTLAFRHEARRLVGENARSVYTREILPQKLALNLEYVKHQNLLYDLRIIVKTLGIVFRQSKG